MSSGSGGRFLSTDERLRVSGYGEEVLRVINHPHRFTKTEIDNMTGEVAVEPIVRAAVLAAMRFTSPDLDSDSDAD